MSEKNSFSNIQRRNSAVMAKYEWTSSLMNMQKSGHEIHDRRIKTHRKANEFLQGLLQKRSDGSLLDDNGTIDRYEKFLKYKSNFNDDDLLNEFDRRLRALNKDRRQKRSIPIDSNISQETENDIQSLKSTDQKRSIPIDLQISQETETDIQSLTPTDRIKSVSKSTITSNNSLLSNISSNDNPTNICFNMDQYPSSSTSSLTSASNHSMTKTLHRPKARRADGTEVIVASTKRSLRRASSDILIFHHCHFPRSLKPREQVNINVISDKQVSPSPTIEQYDHNQVFHLLDQIENECSPVHFTTMLDQLTLSTVQIHQIDDNNNNNNNLSFINNHENEYEENISINPNLFDQPALSQEYYKTFNTHIDDPKKVLLYTMTIGIVQLSPSLTVPYSILNGRRPLLQSSVQTNFRKIYRKQPKHISRVTAIDSTKYTELLKENDIILRINDQSVWQLTTETIRDILQQSNDCLLTVARLSQPFI